MIPYLEIPPLKLGPLELQAFGALAAIGILIGARLAARAARTFAPGDDGPLVDVAPWCVTSGLLGGHLLHVLGYHPELLERHGFLHLFKFWDGLSSMGGVLGALVGIFAYFAWRKWRVGPYLNALALGAAPGWTVARMGCVAAHDHPGIKTDFFLGVNYPDGVRHDLGLYDMLVLAAISALLWWLARKPRPEGVLMGVLAVAYSIPRFFFDFLRVEKGDYQDALADGRIAGLTPAQYITLVLVGVGVWLIVRARSWPPVENRRAASAEPVAAGG